MSKWRVISACAQLIFLLSALALMWQTAYAVTARIDFGNRVVECIQTEPVVLQNQVLRIECNNIFKDGFE